MILDIVSLCILSFFLVLFLQLLVLLAIVPIVEITPPEPQQEPINQRRGVRRQLRF